jgi:hypothetical protein
LRNILLILICFSFSCSDGKVENNSAKTNRDSIAKDSIGKITKARIVSIDSEILVWKKKQDSLKLKFDLVTDICANKTFCHKNFWGSYFLRDHCLVCGLDSLGQLFMVANTFDGWIDKKGQELYNQSEITVEIGDSVFKTSVGKNSYHSICEAGNSVANVYICACVPEQRCFFNGDDNGILKEIALHPNDKIVFYFACGEKKISPKFTLDRRYKTGIIESVKFAKTFEKINELKEEKIKLSEK